ncbi:hypothetical protein ACFVFJ_44515 [Streptomyces sp. NPDC057717]|uniref:hypothetical protein n=1 Tax=Streptomyces sp. NPDC057717 TaxID=3346224 RepID=UPI003689B29C
MTLDQLTQWAVANPWPAALFTAAALGLTAVAAWGAVRALSRVQLPPPAVLVAALAAAVCTAYSADTSWGFARDWLGMDSTTERASMFAAAEIALLACGLMARANKAATTTETEAGTPGVAGILMWTITGIQVIPCYAQSGLVGGTVRAAIGPVLAGLLWHLAMGLEIRVVKPGALSTGLAALVGRELRERLLSRLGLATRNRTAEQITRDRWTARAVDLAATLAHRHDGWDWHTRRLQQRLDRAVGRAQVGANIEQRRALLASLATRLHSSALPTLDLPSPWEMREPVSPPQPAPVVAYRVLREMQPIDAIAVVANAHPGADNDELRTILGEHGVVVSDTQVDMALRLTASAQPPALGRASAAGQKLFAVHATWDDQEPDECTDDDPDAPAEDADADEADAAADRDLLPDARRVDDAHQAKYKRPAGLRTLQKQLRIGQPRAQRMRALLDGDNS